MVLSGFRKRGAKIEPDPFLGPLNSCLVYTCFIYDSGCVFKLLRKIENTVSRGQRSHWEAKAKTDYVVYGCIASQVNYSHSPFYLWILWWNYMNLTFVHRIQKTMYPVQCNSSLMEQLWKPLPVMDEDACTYAFSETNCVNYPLMRHF